MKNGAPVRFSVVIPAWNAAATIVASVQSALGQSEPPYELIVVDDGSTDGTGQLLLTHFGERIVYLRHTGNKGPAAARNAGIARATGDYIAFLDADDYWHPDKLRLVGEVLAAPPETGFLFHSFTLHPFPPLPAARPAATMYPFWKLLLRNPVATPCAVIRRHPDFRFNEAMHHMEDYDLFLRTAWRMPLRFLSLPLTRLGRPVLAAGGQSSNRWKMRRGEWRAYAHLGRLHPLFYLLLPVLIIWSLLKHLYHKIESLIRS